jgi:NAD(P)H-nitrite reductase large subunit
MGPPEDKRETLTRSFLPAFEHPRCYNEAMPLDPDDTICFCFHVPLRKIESFCNREHPKAASQISECLSAGTGCGWCVPMLQKIHTRLCGQYKPWWQQPQPDADYHSPSRDAQDTQIDPDTYAQGRQQYLKETHRKPPQP